MLLALLFLLNFFCTDFVCSASGGEQRTQDYDEAALKSGVWCAEKFQLYRKSMEPSSLYSDPPRTIPPPFCLSCGNETGDSRKEPTTNVLFFVGSRHIHDMTDRHFFHLFCAAAAERDARLAVYMWGWNWPLGIRARTYIKRELSFEANIDRVWKNPHFFDVVITTWQPNSYISMDRAYNESYGSHATAVTYLHEFRQKTQNYVEKALARLNHQFHVVLGSYQEDLTKLIIHAGESVQNTILFALWEHTGGVSPDLVRAYACDKAKGTGNFVDDHHQFASSLTNDCPYTAENIDLNRSLDVCLIGSVGHLYPFRNQLVSFLGDHNETGIFHRIEFSHQYFPSMLSTSRERLNADYLNSIRQCKISLVTGGREFMMLRKYFEVFRWGSLGAGAVPRRLYSSDSTSQTVVDLIPMLLSRPVNSSGIVAELQYWLSHPEERAHKVCQGYQLYGKRTDKTSLHELLRHVKNFKQNAVRGFVPIRSPVVI